MDICFVDESGNSEAIEGTLSRLLWTILAKGEGFGLKFVFLGIFLGLFRGKSIFSRLFGQFSIFRKEKRSKLQLRRKIKK